MTGTHVLIYALAIAIALIIALAAQLGKYISAFRDTATKLWNVTADRDALFIANQGLRSQANKVTTLKPENPSRMKIVIQKRQCQDFPKLMRPVNLPNVFLMVRDGYGIQLSNPEAEYEIIGPWNMSAMMDLDGSVELSNQGVFDDTPSTTPQDWSNFACVTTLKPEHLE